MSNSEQRSAGGRFHLDRYLLSAVLTPLLATLIVSIILLVLDQMLRLLDFIVNQAGPAEMVWRMLANQLPEYFSLGLPIGLFFGVLFAFRRLSLSSELTAMLATGVSMRRLLVPIYALTALMALLTFLTVSYLQPYGQYRYAQIRFAIATGAVGVRVRSGEFIDLPDGAILGAAGTAGDGLRGVFVEDCDAEGACEAMAAERGGFAMDPEGGIQLNLYDGAIVSDPERGAQGVLAFDVWSLPFDLPQFRDRGVNEREATTGELMGYLSASEPAEAERFDAWRAALHWRMAHSLGLFALPLLAIAMGVANRRRDSGVGPVLGITGFVVYNELLEASQRAVAEGTASPYATMWPLLAVFLTINVLLFFLVAERPGGRVIEPAERAWRRLKRYAKPRIKRLAARLQQRRAGGSPEG